MKYADSVVERGDGGGGRSLSLQVLVVYEDLETGLRARQALEQTVQRLEATVDVRVNLWRFDLFREPAFLQHAAKEEADIVFFSTHAQAQLPAAVDSWFREWFARQGDEPRALAVLFDDPGKEMPTATDIMEALGGAARLAGVDVFLYGAETETKWESAIEHIQRRAETKTMLWDEDLHRAERPPFPDWGINE